MLCLCRIVHDKRKCLISPHFLSFSGGAVQRHRNVAVPGISAQLRGKSTTKLESLRDRSSSEEACFPGKRLSIARTHARRRENSNSVRETLPIVAIVNPRVTVFFRERSHRSSVRAHSTVREGGREGGAARCGVGPPPILNQNEAIYPSHRLTDSLTGSAVHNSWRRWRRRHLSEKPTFLSKDTYFPRKEGREGKGNIYSRPAAVTH